MSPDTAGVSGIYPVEFKFAGQDKYFVFMRRSPMNIGMEVLKYE